MLPPRRTWEAEAMDGAGAVVLVEGTSDRAALDVLAARRGLDLVAAGVEIVPIGGATNIRRYLNRYGPRGLGRRVAGLCDAGEERSFRRALAAAGFGSDLTTAGMERLGFFVCDADLEDELIRALGTDVVESIVAAEGDLESFRRFQKQPAQRERPLHDQLHRFMGTRSGRTLWYAHVLAEAVALDRVPRPLTGLLDAVDGGG
jgi:hypothetical protein